MYDGLITDLVYQFLFVFISITIPLLIFYEIFLMNRRLNEKLDRVVAVLQRIETQNRAGEHRSKRLLENRIQCLEKALFAISQQNTGLGCGSEKLEIGAREHLI